jgi:periplasmic divalent cation tolerance protein
MTGDYLLVLTTCPDAESARAIARALVGERLAACVNRIDGVVSTYRWQGDAHVRRADFNPPSSWPVETGPTGALPVARGSAGYLRWIAEATA